MNSPIEAAVAAVAAASVFLIRFGGMTMTGEQAGKVGYDTVKKNPNASAPPKDLKTDAERKGWLAGAQKAKEEAAKKNKS